MFLVVVWLSGSDTSVSQFGPGTAVFGTGAQHAAGGISHIANSFWLGWVPVFSDMFINSVDQIHPFHKIHSVVNVDAIGGPKSEV